MIEISDIIIAVENKENFVLDDFIRQGTFFKTHNGQLQRYVGGFTAVFPVEVKQEKWAFRCWHAEMGNVRRRFEKIAHAISKAKAKYLCDFAYTDEGIIVKGMRYPTTRMRWVEGQPIKEYICANANNLRKLKALAQRFLEMVQDMHKHGFAHGDLQHGNIIIDKYGEPYLVDYDSFYCPELKGESDIITGLADYQHPSRKTNLLSNEKLDYFSELVIYLSILAIAEQPLLVQKYQVADSERMLFAASDYRDIKHSAIYADLKQLSPTIQQLLSILLGYLSKSSIEELEPFDVVLDRMNIQFSLSSTKIRKGRESAVLSWDVRDANHISLYNGVELMQDNLQMQDHISVSPLETTTYYLQLEDKTGKIIKKECTLFVCEEAEVVFSTDKKYVFPSIPFTLSWAVKNAKHIELDGLPVEAQGQMQNNDGISKGTTFILSVTDEFGTKDYPLTIKMLPVPQIEAILVPTPEISKEINVSVSIPTPIVNLEFRQPEIRQVELPTQFGVTIEDLQVQVNEPQMVELNFHLPKKTWWNNIVTNITNKIKSLQR